MRYAALEEPRSSTSNGGSCRVGDRVDRVLAPWVRVVAFAALVPAVPALAALAYRGSGLTSCQTPSPLNRNFME